MLVPNWNLMDCRIAGDAPGDIARWRMLAARSLVPSGHNAPELMAVAVSHWQQGRLALVQDADDLRLAMPLVRRRMPMAVHENWSSPINFFGVPHVDRDLAAPALTALLRKIATPLILRSAPLEGPLWEALCEASSHVRVLRRWQRAVLRPSGTYAGWFEGNFDRKRRNTLRRLRSRLAEQGQLEAVSFDSHDGATLWASDFLALEGAGWKGRRQTALTSDGVTSRSFCSACEALAKSGGMRFWKLALDGRPVAMLFGYADGSEVWLGKIAYDEAFAKFSPGVLLVLHATEQLFAQGVTLADSCAGPDHPMVDNIWRERLSVGDVMLAGPNVPRPLFEAAVLADRCRTTVRHVARNARNRLMA